MTDETTPDEDREEARRALSRAIAAYAETTDPGSYVDGWAVIIHKRDIELEARGQSMVTTITPDGQAWPLTRGLLDVALTADRNEQNDADEDD